MVVYSRITNRQKNETMLACSRKRVAGGVLLRKSSWKR
jgi:hypothetical protein